MITERSRTLTRSGDVSGELYQDAIKRKEKAQSTSKKINVNGSSIPKNDDIYIIQKFEKEFNRCYDSVVQGNSGIFSFQQLKEFCNQFNCVTKDNTSEEEKSLLQELWKNIEKNNESEKYRKNLMEIFKEILLIQSNPKSSLHRKFFQFYINRQFAQKKANEACQKEEKLPFKPAISAKTKELAAKIKKKFNQNDISIELKLLKQDNELRKYYITFFNINVESKKAIETVI